MSTSLAEQLRRLRAPQTSLLADSKKRPSILYDPKEAANTDRATIFELAHNGLMELVSLSLSFLQFEQTLFDRSTLNFERSVADQAVNRHLDKTIKRFFHHLSPYFMLQPAHMCLEWLIRRYHIEQFNVTELLQLILPYHETKIFVRCIQLLRLSDPNHPWGWLLPIQRPGVPLSKSAILNRAATDSAFLKFVCKSTADAVKDLELDAKAHTLQAQLAFYCTTVIGALEYAVHINEWHVITILPSLLKGLTSKVLDFAAATNMITAQLVSKATLSPKFIHALIAKISENGQPALQNDRVLLLVLIFDKQSKNLKTIPNEVLKNLVEKKWLPGTLGQMAGEGIVLSSFLASVMSKCLHQVQTKGDDWLACKAFVEQLLLDVHLKENEAKDFIRCVLDSYKQKEPSVATNEVIEIDSDDDMMDVDTKSWYSDYLQKLERQYPSEFDFTIKETMQGRENVSESRKQALKTALAFRLKSLYSEDNIPIYENLYHHNASNRIEAVKYLVKNFNKLTLSPNDKLLRDSLIDRLSDDDPKVLNEALKMNTAALVKALGAAVTVEKLLNILHKRKRGSGKWLKVTTKVLEHLAKRSIWPENDGGRILVAVLPFLLPTTNAEVPLAQEILSGDIIDVVPLLKAMAIKLRAVNDPEVIAATTLKLLSSAKDLPTVDALLELFDSRHYVYFLLLWTVSYQHGSDPATGIKIFDIIRKTAKQSEFRALKPNEKWFQTMRPNEVPLSMMLECLLAIAKQTKLSSLARFHDCSSDSASLILKIFEFLATNAFISHKEYAVKAGYTEALKTFLDSICPSAADKFEFLANFFVLERIDGIESMPELQIRAIRLFCILIETRTERDSKLDRLSFVKVLIALNNEIDVIRECALNTLEALGQNEALEPKFDLLARQILERREEITLDHEQFPLVLFMLIATSKKSKAASVLEDFIAIVIDPAVENVVKAATLRIMNHLAVFSRIIKAGIDVLQHIETIGEQCLLDQARSDILKYVVAQLQNSTKKILADGQNAWNLLAKLLKLHSVTMLHEKQIRSVAVLVMDVFDEELYKKLPKMYKTEFVEHVVRAITFANDNSLISSGNRLVKRIALDGTHIVPVLAGMKNSCTTVAGLKGAKAIAPDPNVLNSAEWKMGITLLELLQSKKKIENFMDIVPTLVELLQKCLEFMEQSNLEYAKQLILSCLLQCCQEIAASGSRKNVIPDNTFRIDLVVQCIRATQNPQTHHHALLLLSQCAAMFPQQVLLNIIEIFTFMGSSVVRYDDAFSIQIITKIVETIVPTLTGGGVGSESGEEQRVVAVLRVFSDIILDVPEHRRIPMYTKLVRTLGSKKYLWMFLCVLLESQVVHDENEKEKLRATQRRFATISDETPKRIEFALQLLKDFDADVALFTCIDLFEYLRTLPTEKDDDEKMPTDGAETVLFDVEQHSSKLLRHFKYVLVQFISNFTSSPEFINRIAELDDESTKAMKPLYQEFLIKILCCVPQVTAAIEQNSDSVQVKYWKVILHHCYDVLENAISLLSPDMLLVVVHGLMQHKLPTVRKKVIEILIAKLQYQIGYFADCNEEYLVNLLQPLNEILDSILDKNATHTPEIVFIQQTALIAIKLLSRVMASKHAMHFKKLLTKLTKILKKRDSIAKILLATVFLAITEICSNLKAHSISLLSKFMPRVIDALHDHSQALASQSPDTVTIAIVTGIQKLFEALPLFLGPYMVEILIALITVWSYTAQYEEEARATVVLTKLKAICEKIASTCPLRIVIPVCDKTYRKLYEAEQYAGIKFLMKLVKDCVEKLNGDEIQAQQSDLYEFFLTVLEFRTQLAESKDQTVISSVEESILQSFVALILKLSESSFRPLYHKVYDWAIRENEQQKDRAITYFLLSSKIAEALKSLFVLFASDFVKDAADLLNKCNSFKSDELYFVNSDAKNVFLVENILSTLNNVFVHDSKGFINEHRFDILMQPIVDQLQNRLVLENESLIKLLISCVAELAFVVRNDTLWKQLNYQVLLKTRSNDPEIRIVSIKCCVAVARKLGEQFVPLLPETIPFVAELLEDENERVEKACRKEIAELERVTGVSLNQFF